MVILNPADHYEMMAATKAAIEYKGPVYIRLGRLAVDSFTDQFGKIPQSPELQQRILQAELDTVEAVSYTHLSLP